MRILFLIAAIVGVFLIVRMLLRNPGRKTPEEPGRPATRVSCLQRR
ncbi:MAG: hypothetical protein LC667_12115 [Thioalkalivibrio sp.]|nr:hypothetical protein [Thioalkalivibrio sp.]